MLKKYMSYYRDLFSFIRKHPILGTALYVQAVVGAYAMNKWLVKKAAELTENERINRRFNTVLDKVEASYQK